MADSDQGKENLSENKSIHYVIVVHGIGEQRPNETLIPVINRFAQLRQEQLDAARANQLPRKNKKRKKREFGQRKWKDRLSLGKLTSQLSEKDFNKNDRSWVQLSGIPSKFPEHGDDFFFNGQISSGDDDIRFVDMHWADILNKHHDKSGQSIENWTDTVIARLVEKEQNKFDRLKYESGKVKESDKLDNWIISILEQIQETSIFAKVVAGLPWVGKGKEVKEILDKFVGDIQVYGENSSVRGEAVSRFHQKMQELESHHDKSKHGRPKYTIIAHSLGTVMALDSLIYAHVKRSKGYPTATGIAKEDDSSKRHNIPFIGYSNKAIDEARKTDSFNEKLPLGFDWIDNVESFVTLGSPIDKYLTLWSENYRYLGEKVEAEKEEEIQHLQQLDVRQVYTSDLSIDDINEEEKKEDGLYFKFRSHEKFRISHFNYCDEQDPVGHHLDLLRETSVYKKIFACSVPRDKVFKRYKIPGKAHVDYWEDEDLFREIMYNTVDKESLLKQVEIENITEKEEEERLIIQESGKEIKSLERNWLKSPKWAIIFITYFLPTLLTSILISALFLWGWDALKGEKRPEVKAELVKKRNPKYGQLENELSDIYRRMKLYDPRNPRVKMRVEKSRQKMPTDTLSDRDNLISLNAPAKFITGKNKGEEAGSMEQVSDFAQTVFGHLGSKANNKRKTAKRTKANVPFPWKMEVDNSMSASLHLISWKSAIAGSFLLCLSAYFFKKILTLFVWWRQILRLKREKRWPKEEKKKRTRQIGVFQIFMMLILIILAIYSSLLIARCVKFPHDPEMGWNFALIYSIMLIVVSLVILGLSKLIWSRSWSFSPRKILPELLTLLFVGLISLAVFFLLNSDSTWILEDPNGSGQWIDRQWLPKLAILITALTITWAFVLISAMVSRRMVIGKLKLRRRNIEMMTFKDDASIAENIIVSE